MTRRVAVSLPLVAFLAVGALFSLARSGAGAPPSIGLVEKEFLFTPKDVVVRWGGGIAFVVKNQGAIEHNFVLEAPGGTTVAQITTIEPGETGRVTATLPAGIYTIYCSLPGHRDAGMVATLRVGP